MESDAVSSRGDARTERTRKKAKIMDVIRKEESADPTRLHERLYIDDAELGEILTEMLRSGEIEYHSLAQGRAALRLTPLGVAVHERAR